MRVFLFFVDGLGLGSDDPAVNPLLVAEMPALRSLLGGRPLTAAAVPYAAGNIAVVPTDPRLGVAGLPQSATGQTTIFTGKNASAAIGRHLNAYPTPNLKAILNEHSVFLQVKRLGLKGTFLNAFQPAFFEWVAAGQPLHKDRHYRPSASTVSGLAAGMETFRSLEQLRRGEAVGFDIDHHILCERGCGLEPVAAEEAGRRAARVANTQDFTLYEHFLTDKAGHAAEMVGAVVVLERLDRFLSGILAELADDVLLIITSDHGNIEDLSVSTHTYNDVATILKGPHAADAAARIHTLMDITPVIIDLLTKAAGEGP